MSPGSLTVWLSRVANPKQDWLQSLSASVESSTQVVQGFVFRFLLFWAIVRWYFHWFSMSYCFLIDHNHINDEMKSSTGVNQGMQSHLRSPFQDAICTMSLSPNDWEGRPIQVKALIQIFLLLTVFFRTYAMISKDWISGVVFPLIPLAPSERGSHIWFYTRHGLGWEKKKNGLGWYYRKCRNVLKNTTRCLPRNRKSK